MYGSARSPELTAHPPLPALMTTLVRSRRRTSSRVSQEFPSTSAHSGPNASRPYPAIEFAPWTASVPSSASALPAAGEEAAGVVALAVADGTGAADEAAGEVGEPVGVAAFGAAGCGEEETGTAPEPHPATPSTRPPSRPAHRATRVRRIDPLSTRDPRGAGPSVTCGNTAEAPAGPAVLALPVDRPSGLRHFGLVPSAPSPITPGRGRRTCRNCRRLRLRSGRLESGRQSDLARRPGNRAIRRTVPQGKSWPPGCDAGGKRRAPDDGGAARKAHHGWLRLSVFSPGHSTANGPVIEVGSRDGADSEQARGPRMRRCRP